MKRSPLTYTLLFANVAIFGLELLIGSSMVQRYALWPIGAGFAPWQILSSAFLHGSPMHLAANMLGLFVFGRDVEAALGRLRFATLYALSMVTAALAQLAVSALLHDAHPVVGASGALFGVMVAFAMLFPKRVIILLFPPIPLPAPLFVVLYAAFELYAGVTGSMSGVAHFAHLGGLVGGFLLMRTWRPRSSRR
ncbi:rhomboid family intramembrane serine protease [Solimonas terrae]|uniref:rhomboid family intramembrane serine protease n=1 Tax=Solimonas terrae TaxID=1396819 RepID=UPI0015834A52|nr:rhomboid family intramembrane serine protease [Solimonas terrae]